MAAAVVTQPADIPSRNPTPPPSLTLNTSLETSHAPIPNKHIPYCSPGTAPQYGLLSPPATPPDRAFIAHTQSVLFPPDPHDSISQVPPVYSIAADTAAQALHSISARPSPDPDQIFPWLHGLHPDNQIQQSFFCARRNCSRRTPKCLRGVTLVKAGGDLGIARLRGAIAPDEILTFSDRLSGEPMFHHLDPRSGFSVRNFHIQASKMATVSDIIVYGDDGTPRDELKQLAQDLSQAQLHHRTDPDSGEDRNEFNTFVVTDPFERFEEQYPDLVAVDAKGDLTGAVMDFLAQERLEMCNLSEASEIARNVWLGPTPDPTSPSRGVSTPEDPKFDMLIEASDFAAMPDAYQLLDVESFLENDSNRLPAHLEFPSSGSFAACENGSQDDTDVNRLVLFCRWVHRMANEGVSVQASVGSHEYRDGDEPMSDAVEKRPQRVLIHCTDGYTETTLLAIAYCMFAEGVPAHEAWVRLHVDKQRNFFAYPPDKAFLENVQLRLLEHSPRLGEAPPLIERPMWMQKMDGSLPSRILPYLYLGNLNHAQNPELLQKLGITRVLSVGETIAWSPDEVDAWGQDNLTFIDNVQDNGVDSLTGEFERCLEFISQTKNNAGATLVHCRVGVSRSATICIAEVMNEMGLSYPRAYCFVRARRLNVIIQPHLRFSYELLKWEETRQQRRGLPVKRELEWPTIAREIALMNKPYCRQ